MTILKGIVLRYSVLFALIVLLILMGVYYCAVSAFDAILAATVDDEEGRL